MNTNAERERPVDTTFCRNLLCTVCTLSIFTQMKSYTPNV